MPPIRRLTEADVAAYRAIRLAMPEDAPDAFATPREVEAARSPSHFAATLRDAIVLAAEGDGTLLAVARLTPGAPPKEAHKASINGFFVRPAQRNRGLAGALMTALIETARPRFERLVLAVVADNAAALALYRRFGFTEYGREPQARKSDGRYQDVVLMALRLTAD